MPEPVFALTQAPDEAALAPLWRDLEAQADPPFFLSWFWIGTWLSLLDARPMLLTGRVDGRLVLTALLVRSRTRAMRVWPLRALRLHTTGDPGQDVITIEYNGFLVAREWQGRAETAALAFLTGRGAGCDELHLRNVPDTLAPLLPPGLLVQEAARKPSWRVDLDAVRSGGRPYLDGLSANTRQQIRRSLRLYEGRDGPLTATRAPSVAEASTFLAGLKELHQPYWEARGEKGAFGHPFFVRFLERLVERALPAEAIELVRIGSADKAIGYLVNFRYHGGVYAYLSGFRYEADAKLKPGLVSHALCIETHVLEGAGIYDFMAGENRYKASLGQPGPDMLYLVARPQSLPARLELAARAVKHRLGR